MPYKINFTDELCHAKKGETIPGSKYVSRKWNGKSWSYIYTTAKRETKAAVAKIKTKVDTKKTLGGKKYYNNGNYDYQGAYGELVNLVKNSDYAKKNPEEARIDLYTLTQIFNENSKKTNSAAAMEIFANKLLQEGYSEKYGTKVAKRAKEISDEARSVARSNTKKLASGEGWLSYFNR